MVFEVIQKGEGTAVGSIDGGKKPDLRSGNREGGPVRTGFESKKV